MHTLHLYMCNKFHAVHTINYPFTVRVWVHMWQHIIFITTHRKSISSQLHKTAVVRIFCRFSIDRQTEIRSGCVYWPENDKLLPFVSTIKPKNNNIILLILVSNCGRIPFNPIQYIYRYTLCLMSGMLTHA